MAACTLPEGTVVLEDSAFVAAVLFAKRKLLCNQCFQEAQLKACSRCHTAFYCGTECQAKDWIQTHKDEVCVQCV